MTTPGPPGQWPQEQFVDPLTGEPIPNPYGSHPYGSRPSAGEPGYPEAAAARSSAESATGTVDDSAAGAADTAAPAGPVVAPPLPGTGLPTTVSGRRRAITPRRMALSVAAALVLGVAVLIGGNPAPEDSGASAIPTDVTMPPLPNLPPPATAQRMPVAPVVPGWQGVAVPRYGVAYDVPPDWHVESPSTLVGYDDSSGRPLVIMSGVSTYKGGFCAGHRYSYLAHLGFSHTDLTDPVQAARHAVQDWADAGYSGGKGTGAAQVAIGAPTPTPLAGGSITATQVAGIVTVAAPKECDAHQVLIDAVAVPLPGGPPVIALTESDQNVPVALPDADLQRIIGTIRPLHR